GHAVNPSLGARWRHPWRQRSCAARPASPRQFPAGADASDPKAGARAKAKAKAKPGIAASAFDFEFEFEFDLSSPGYPAGEEGAGDA
ncbi:hypothetical protein, partial [Stenotrophomonas maltophilia]|uniref:hypothetical protein n=1 Tax=Stenotrophomonas maltophilia TaxID=40324 RepID=UPI001955ABA2